MPKFNDIKKVLVLGSGAIKIGEAGEFDYSGSQCIKALKEEGIYTVLVNPNIATIQTDEKMADKIYFLPVTPEFVKTVIEKERPDGILLTFGGQTALNCGTLLKKMGILDEYGVRVLGTSVETIETASDRKKFRETMIKNNIPVARSAPAYSVEEAKKIANELNYPVMIRVAFTLGGKGGGIAHDERELEEIVSRGLAHSLIKEVLIEEYLGDLKQIEYEVMRDYKGNTITVCNMENILGMRVHTGDNIVIAPSQTLTNEEYHTLRKTSIEVVKAIKVVGECNVQFALDSESGKHYVIEVNPRMSRSSALASKATGYPLAYIAAKLAIGYTLDELINKVTRLTTAAFEPSLDYVVIKFPRWDYRKFSRVDRRLRTQMKSVGEVMAIGRNFEEAIQKAIRMLDIGKDGLVANEDEKEDETEEKIIDNLRNPTDEIFFYVVKAIRKGIDLKTIQKLTCIDEWYLRKMKNIIEMEEELRKSNFNDEKLHEKVRKAKQLGFSDKQISRCLNVKEEDIRKFRINHKIIPVVKQIDTLAAEWPSKTNYLYLTYNGITDDIEFNTNKSKIIVLGAGPYRIGSSVEFDWATMNMVWSLKSRGIDEVIVINCNPETVSTDFDMSDKLYFEELTVERIMDIYEKENPLGIVTSVGGQIANNVTPKLAKYNVKILGTSPESIDNAEDREKFSKLLDSLGIKQPKWKKFTNLEEVFRFGLEVGYPLLVRPSYVLSGSAMRVVWIPLQLKQYLTEAAKVSKEYPVVVSKFIKEALEVEVDAVSDTENTFIGAIIEHLEHAGLHSGDATLVIPPIRLTPRVEEKIAEIANKIAKSLKIKGLFNIQFLVKDDDVYVIECNLRASRSMPFVSKTNGVNLVDLAAEVIINGKLPKEIVKRPRAKYAVKVAQFSFMQVDDADPVLGVEMQSTGEVACFGNTFFEAFLKSLIAAGYKIPFEGGNVLISVSNPEIKSKIVPLVIKLKKLGYNLYATEHTAEYLRERGIDNVTVLYKIREPERKPNIMDYLKERKLDLVINIPSGLTLYKYASALEDEYIIRRKAVELNIPVFTNFEMVKAIVEGIEWYRNYTLSENGILYESIQS
jgi:carbamoyl-phosphate synthase large subunit